MTFRTYWMLMGEQSQTVYMLRVVSLVRKKERKKEREREREREKGREEVRSSVPLLGSIPSGHLLSTQTLWLLCVCLRYGLGCALSDRPLHTFLCSPPASLGRWTNWFGRWLFKGHIWKLLTGSSPPPTLSFLHASAALPSSRSHPAAARQAAAGGGPGAV